MFCFSTFAARESPCTIRLPSVDRIFAYFTTTATDWGKKRSELTRRRTKSQSVAWWNFYNLHKLCSRSFRRENSDEILSRTHTHSRRQWSRLLPSHRWVKQIVLDLCTIIHTTPHPQTMNCAIFVQFCSPRRGEFYAVVSFSRIATQLTFYICKTTE